LGYPEDDARLLGYSTALLYAIFKAKAQAKKESAESTKKKELPTEIAAKTKTLRFGGQDFQVIYFVLRTKGVFDTKGKASGSSKPSSATKSTMPTNTIRKSRRDSQKVGTTVLPRHLIKYLDGYGAGQLDNLFDLYKRWRDGCKVGFNRVDLEKLAAWLKERAG